MAEVSVPVLGVIFLSAAMMYYDEKKGLTQFPSPYWGLFFYLELITTKEVARLLVDFRPHFGDYFFI